MVIREISSNIKLLYRGKTRGKVAASKDMINPRRAVTTLISKLNITTTDACSVLRTILKLYLV